MSNAFSKNSLKELNTCHKDLVDIMNEAIKECPLDFSIVQGARTIEQARENYKNGKSKLNPDKGQFSKHITGNIIIDGKKVLEREKAIAVDICPYIGGKLAWNDNSAFIFIAGYIHGIAIQKGVKLRYGGGWDLYKNTKHLNTTGQLEDSGHFELLD